MASPCLCKPLMASEPVSHVKPVTKQIFGRASPEAAREAAPRAMPNGAIMMHLSDVNSPWYARDVWDNSAFYSLHFDQWNMYVDLFEKKSIFTLQRPHNFTPRNVSLFIFIVFHRSSAYGWHPSTKILSKEINLIRIKASTGITKLIGQCSTK